MSTERTSRGSIASNSGACRPLPRPKAVACQKCHSRKVKCPGGQPCHTCLQMNTISECVYPKRDRQIKISQSYLDNLIKENERLRVVALAEPSATVPQDNQDLSGNDTDVSDAAAEEPHRNPLLNDEPWFLSNLSCETPILVGESADAAFATRFRQTLSGNAINHISRTSYPATEHTMLLASVQCPQPSVTQARFFVRSALTYSDGYFCIVNGTAIQVLLERYIGEPASLDLLSRCKILALFALGELHSSRSSSLETNVPGLLFFSHASQAYGLLQERPCVDAMEVLLLLCLYSLCINRRHSAYLLASSAIRLGTVIGLQYDLPSSHFTNQSEKEHLHRVWWNAYVLDYECSALSGQILSIADNDILVNLPSKQRSDELTDIDFRNRVRFNARVQLAQISRDVLKSLYGRSHQKTSFSQRLQTAVKSLRNWLQGLPEDLKIGLETTQPRNTGTEALQLCFNQCVILATRPILLHMLKARRQDNQEVMHDQSRKVSQEAKSLAEACIRCAEQSYAILTEAWVDGSFRTFDYFRTQYLFSAATVLAVASILDDPSGTKRQDFEFAAELLKKLSDYGNYAAFEMVQHVEAMNAEIRDSETTGSAHITAQGVMEVHSLTSIAEGDLEDRPRDRTVFDMGLPDPLFETIFTQHDNASFENQLEGLYLPMHDIGYQT